MNDTPIETNDISTGTDDTPVDTDAPPTVQVPFILDLAELMEEGTAQTEGDMEIKDGRILLTGEMGAMHFTMPAGCFALEGTVTEGAVTILRDGVALASGNASSPELYAAIASGESVTVLMHGAQTTLTNARLTSETAERMLAILEPVGGYVCHEGTLTLYGSYAGAESVTVTVGEATYEALTATDGTWQVSMTGVADDTLSVKASADGLAVERSLALTHTASDAMYADDMEWLKATCHTSRSEPTRGKSFDTKHDLRINGVTYRHGIGTHARDAGQDDAEISLAVPEGYTVFEAVVGLDDRMSPDGGSVEFLVLLDGKIVARSGLMKSNSENHTFSVDVSQATTITLRTTNGADSATYDAADWCNARFVKVPSESMRVLAHTVTINDMELGEFSYLVAGDHVAAAASVEYIGTKDSLHLTFLVSAYGEDGSLIGRATSHHEPTVNRIGTVSLASELLTVGSTRPARVTLRVVDEDTDTGLLYTELPTAVLTRAEPERTDLYDSATEQTGLITFNKTGELAYHIIAADGFGKLSVTLDTPVTDTMAGTSTAVISLYRFTESVINTSYTTPVFSESVTIDEAMVFTKRFTDVPAGEYLLTILPTSGIVAVKNYIAGDTPSGVIYQNHRILEGALPVSIYYHNSDTVQSTTPEGKKAISRTSTLPAEKQRAESIYNGYLNDLSTLPVSFQIGSTSYRGFGADFTEIGRTSVANGDKVSTLISLRHTSGLTATLDMAAYYEYAAFEWTVYFTNDTASDSPIISNLKAVDLYLEGAAPTLNGLNGDAVNEITSDTMNNQPYTIVLEEDRTYSFASRNGRPTDTSFPYYDFTYGDGGVLMAIGWEGQWSSSFRYKDGSTRFRAGQERFRAYLKPGETIRTPLMAFVYYDGRNSDRSTNLWRHWFIDCNMPTTSDGTVPEPVLGGTTSDRTGCMTLTDEAYQIDAIQDLYEHGLEVDCWWMDAGWYTISTEGQSITELLQYGNTGTWVVDAKRFPTKFRAISDAANALGCRTLLWFEPERFGIDVNTLKTDGSTLKKEWIITSPEGWNFVNYGDPEAVEWMTRRVIGILEEGGISIYREDFNIPPLSTWRANDEADRSGMTENLYVQGHLQFWDNLREHFPGMILDSCASGGRRNDLESLRRAVPLHISDYFIHDLDRRQSVHYALFKWFPYFKAEATPNCLEADEYALRNALVAWPQIQFDFNRTVVNLDAAHDFVALWEECNSYFYADYYTLTEWSIDPDEWIGWMFVDEDEGGFAQFFRRADSPDSERLVKFKGLDADATYELIDVDGHCGGTYTGFELMKHGVTILIPEAESSAVIRIIRK